MAGGEEEAEGGAGGVAELRTRISSPDYNHGPDKLCRGSGWSSGVSPGTFLPPLVLSFPFKTFSLILRLSAALQP